LLHDGVLTLRPRLPQTWQALRFSILVRGSICRVAITPKEVSIAVDAAAAHAVDVVVGNQRKTVQPGAQASIAV